MSEKVSITFDEENNIRVLEADKYRESDQLKSQAMEFITKVALVLVRQSASTKLSPQSPRPSTNLPSKSRDKNFDHLGKGTSSNVRTKIGKRKWWSWITSSTKRKGSWRGTTSSCRVWWESSRSRKPSSTSWATTKHDPIEVSFYNYDHGYQKLILPLVS